MVPPVPIRTSLGRPSRRSTGASFLTLSAGASRTAISAESVILTPTLYPLFILIMRTSGSLNSWWGISVPTKVLPSLVTDILEPSTAPSDESLPESESE